MRATFRAIASILGPHIPLRTLFSGALSLCSSFKLKNQVSNTYKTEGKNTL